MESYLIKFLKGYIPTYVKEVDPKMKLEKEQIEDMAYGMEEDLIDTINYQVGSILGFDEDED